MNRAVICSVILTALYPSPLRAIDAIDVFECSVLGEWAGLDQQSQKLAQQGFNLASDDVRQSIDGVKEASQDRPNFLLDRSADFWKGMWYGQSQVKIEEWLQTQQPVPLRPGAAAPERVMVALRRAEVWKPIAAQEFVQRACSFRLVGKN
ncbi:hypothetical protein AB9F35_17220 [Rhizobium leguminosarum]|uniref:hypothetical protein n=1 Tax=Rhizobium leguminosarum TaxID=384 RepID=UPI003F9E0B3E